VKVDDDLQLMLYCASKLSNEIDESAPASLVDWSCCHVVKNGIRHDSVKSSDDEKSLNENGHLSAPAHGFKVGSLGGCSYRQ
jgi:hypothetical protein